MTHRPAFDPALYDRPTAAEMRDEPWTWEWSGMVIRVVLHDGTMFRIHPVGIPHYERLRLSFSPLGPEVQVHRVRKAEMARTKQNILLRIPLAEVDHIALYRLEDGRFTRDVPIMITPEDWQQEGSR